LVIALTAVAMGLVILSVVPLICASALILFGGGIEKLVRGLVPELGERVQTGIVQRLYPPGGGDPDSFAMLSGVLDKLRVHERDLLSFLIVHKEYQRGSLADWGRYRSAYEHGRSARAFTTGQISSALSSLEELRPA
jgi:hypothetical protein